MSPLTDTKIRNLKPTGKPLKVADGRGLYLEVRPTGAKLWRYRYRIDGKENVFALGEYGKDAEPSAGIYSLAEARVAHLEARKLVKQSLHPSHERRARRAKSADQRATTFRGVATEWLDGKRASWSDGYFQQVKNNLERNVFPELGERPISDINSAHMQEIIQRIARRGTPKIARMNRQWCAAVFRYGITTLRCEIDPCEAIKDAIEAPPTKHHLPLSVEEIPTLLRRIDAYGGRIETVFALKLLLLTFVRGNELRKAAWDEIELDTSLWRIPGERMKNRREHLVPLARQAVELINELKPLTGHTQWLFPGIRQREPISTHTLTKALRYMGYEPGQFSAHGVRSTASTQLNEMGFRADVIERQLAHLENNETRASYNHAMYLPERRELMQSWADLIGSTRTSDG